MACVGTLVSCAVVAQSVEPVEVNILPLAEDVVFAAVRLSTGSDAPTDESLLDNDGPITVGDGLVFRV